MKKVFTHENRLIVFNLKNILQEKGVECVIKNEFASGGVGDLAPFETWPELWVKDDRDQVLVDQLLMEIGSNDNGSVWQCRQCMEENEGQFGICWKCGHSKTQS